MANRTFAVGAKVGRKSAGWPFARLDVGDEAIRVRCWPVPWFGSLSIGKEVILDISIYTYSPGLYYLKVKDSGENYAKVSVYIPIRPEHVIGELRARGYPVTDRRRRALPQGIVPWGTHE
jgi:hypothetical protein